MENVRPQIRRLIEFVKQDYTNDSAYYAIGRDFLLAHGVPDSSITREFINQLLDAFRSPWYQYFFRHDPMDDIAKLKIPLLLLHGSADKVVPPSIQYQMVINLMDSAGSEKIRAISIPAHDHFFLLYKGKMLKKHRPGEMDVSEFMMMLAFQWLMFQGIVSEAEASKFTK